MADLGIGTVDPILGVYKGVAQRPIYGDFCHQYVNSALGFPVTTYVGCQSTKCAVEGNCPASASASPMPVPQNQFMPQSGQWIAGVDNNIVLIGAVVVIALIVLVWRK